MTQFLTSPADLDLRDLERRARAMQARAMRDMGRRTWTRVTGLFRH